MNSNLTPSQEYSRQQSVRAAKMLLNAVGGDPKKIPASYRESLSVEYGENSGKNWLTHLDKIQGKVTDELLESMSYSEADLPVAEDVISIFPEAFDSQGSSENFAEGEEVLESGGDLDEKMPKFLKAVIETVYTSGINMVSDEAGKPPTVDNNYLLSEDGKSYNGIFNDRKEVFTFKIYETSADKWSITYKLKGEAPDED